MATQRREVERIDSMRVLAINKSYRQVTQDWELVHSDRTVTKYNHHWKEWRRVWCQQYGETPQPRDLYNGEAWPPTNWAVGQITPGEYVDEANLVHFMEHIIARPLQKITKQVMAEKRKWVDQQRAEVPAKKAETAKAIATVKSMKKTTRGKAGKPRTSALGHGLPQPTGSDKIDKRRPKSKTFDRGRGSNTTQQPASVTSEEEGAASIIEVDLTDEDGGEEDFVAQDPDQDLDGATDRGLADEEEPIIVKNQASTLLPKFVTKLRLQYNTVHGYITAINNLYEQQRATYSNPAPSPNCLVMRTLKKDVLRNIFAYKRLTNEDRIAGTIRDDYDVDMVPKHTDACMGVVAPARDVFCSMMQNLYVLAGQQMTFAT